MEMNASDPETLRYWESLMKLAKISEEAQKIKNEKKKLEEASSNDPNSSENGSETKNAEIPAEQQIEPAARVPLFKIMVPWEKVEKTLKNMEFMPKEQLIEALRPFPMANLNGTRKELKNRVAEWYRAEKRKHEFSREGPENFTLRHFDYLICLDFEATCCQIQYQYPHEIIEFPAVLVDVKTARIVGQFHSYVRPVVNPKLDPFCVRFTGITQDDVDNAPPFREVLLKFYRWMSKFELGGPKTRFAFVTDGPHDLWKFFQYQCILSQIKMPHVFRRFVNIKGIFKATFAKFNEIQGNGKSGIENMLDILGEKFTGNAHSGLDDAKNIAKVVIQMIRLNFQLYINQKCVGLPWKSEQLKTKEELAKMSTREIHYADFKFWCCMLPLRPQLVFRHEMESGAYSDCDSCDEEREEMENDEELRKQNLAMREELEAAQKSDFAKMCEEYGHSFVIGETQPVPYVLEGELLNPPNLQTEITEPDEEKCEIPVSQTVESPKKQKKRVFVQSYVQNYPDVDEDLEEFLRMLDKDVEEVEDVEDKDVEDVEDEKKPPETPKVPKKVKPVRNYYQEMYNIEVDTELEAMIIAMDKNNQEDEEDLEDEELSNNPWTKSVDSTGESSEIPTCSTSEPPKEVKKENLVKKYYDEMYDICDVDVEFEELLAKWDKEKDLEDEEDQEDFEDEKKNMKMREELQMAQKDDFAKMRQKTGYSLGTGNPLYPNRSSSKDAETPNSNRKENPVKKLYEEKYKVGAVDVEFEQLLVKWDKEKDLEDVEDQLEDTARLVQNSPNSAALKAEIPSSSSSAPPRGPKKVNPAKKFYEEKDRVKELKDFWTMMETENWNDVNAISSQDPRKIGGPMEYPPIQSTPKKSEEAPKAEIPSSSSSAPPKGPKKQNLKEQEQKMEEKKEEDVDVSIIKQEMDDNVEN